MELVQGNKTRLNDEQIEYLVLWWNYTLGSTALQTGGKNFEKKKLSDSGPIWAFISGSLPDT